MCIGEAPDLECGVCAGAVAPAEMPEPVEPVLGSWRSCPRSWRRQSNSRRRILPSFLWSFLYREGFLDQCAIRGRLYQRGSQRCVKRSRQVVGGAGREYGSARLMLLMRRMFPFTYGLCIFICWCRRYAAAVSRVKVDGRPSSLCGGYEFVKFAGSRRRSFSFPGGCCIIFVKEDFE